MAEFRLDRLSNAFLINAAAQIKRISNSSEDYFLMALRILIITNTNANIFYLLIKVLFESLCSSIDVTFSQLNCFFSFPT
jgi:hypothetical protein